MSTDDSDLLLNQVMSTILYRSEAQSCTNLLAVCNVLHMRPRRFRPMSPHTFLLQFVHNLLFDGRYKFECTCFRAVTHTTFYGIATGKFRFD